MSRAASMEPLSSEAFIERLRDEGGKRYHDHHPFHVRMHAGELSTRTAIVAGGYRRRPAAGRVNGPVVTTDATAQSARASWSSVQFGGLCRRNCTLGRHSGRWQTASTLLPSGSRTKAP